jgi:signal transduction histidine kinase
LLPCFVAAGGRNARASVARCYRIGVSLSVASLPASAPFWRRFVATIRVAQIGWTVGLAALGAAALSPIFNPPFEVVFGRTLVVSIVMLLAYTTAQCWRAPPVPRWLFQVLALVVAAPLATLAVYALTESERSMFHPWRVSGMMWIAGCAVIAGLIMGLGAMVREREAQANAQALQFALEREQLERQAANARLAVLQSQIEPHFLFNTLANVQALVESGSPRAAPVLQSLIAYLRAALPQLHDGAPTLGREATLVRSYLELMQMRMPDRLRFSLHIDASLRDVRVPPLTLLTLVENAVRHGVDPSEQGGAIEVGAERQGAQVRLWVRDSGRGLDDTRAPGTGLANLRERLRSAYGDQARLTLSAAAPQGVLAEVTLPSDG